MGFTISPAEAKQHSRAFAIYRTEATAKNLTSDVGARCWSWDDVRVVGWGGMLSGRCEGAPSPSMPGSITYGFALESCRMLLS